MFFHRKHISTRNLFHIILLVFEVFLLSGRVLVLLVFRYKVVHVGLSFSELHLVHALTGVPVEEGLSSEHRGELLSDALEHILDGGGVAKEGDRHLQSLWWDVAHGGLDVVRDPLNEVRAVLVLHVKHLLINLLRGHAASEHRGCGQVSTMTRIRCAHHVLSIEHLLGQLWHRKRTVLLRTSGRQWGESSHEEVETWEWDKVDCEFSEVGVQLTRESEAARDAGHGSGDEVVKVAVRWGGELQSSEADIIQSFVVNDHDFVGVFDELMDGESRIIWLNDGVGDLWRGEDGECAHHAVWVFLTDLGDQERSHTRPGSATKGVGDLESLKAVTALSLLTHDIKDRVNQFRALSVVAFGPVVSCSGLAEDEVVWSEKLSEWSSSDGVHGSWLEVHEDRAGDISPSGGLVEVNVNALQLEVGIAMIGSSWVNAMLVSNDFPEFCANLVSALSCLNMNDFAHGLSL